MFPHAYHIVLHGFHHPALNAIDSPMSPGIGDHVRGPPRGLNVDPHVAESGLKVTECGLKVDYTWTARGLRVTEWGLDHPDGPVPIGGVDEDGGRVPDEVLRTSTARSDGQAGDPPVHEAELLLPRVANGFPDEGRDGHAPVTGDSPEFPELLLFQAHREAHG
jgi:hypothetical protein